MRRDPSDVVDVTGQHSARHRNRCHDGTEVRVRYRDPQSGDERGGPVGSWAIQHHVGDA